jgi:spore maturation protein CgeB
MNSTPSCFLQEARPHVRLVVGQIGCPISPKIDFIQYDLVLSSLPYYVDRFRNKGLKSELFRLGFERTISDRLMKRSSPYPVVHVGSYDSLHQERNKLLETLIEHGIPLGCWGFGIKHLSATSPIHRCYQGEAWGLKMYNIRHNSLIVVTKHISSVAKGHAAMMTLFETTGVGALLVIDHAKDLPILFEPGKELVAYRTPNECAELIEYYLEHDKEREAIAKAGQQRTLKEHTFYHRMQELLEIVRKYL